jgi:hypothetical protein
MRTLKQEFDQETGTSNDFGFAHMMRSHSMNRISPMRSGRRCERPYRRAAALYASRNSNCHSLYVLIYQNRVSIWIDNHKAGWASGAFVCFCNHVNATIFELALQLSNVNELSSY